MAAIFGIIYSAPHIILILLKMTSIVEDVSFLIRVARLVIFNCCFCFRYAGVLLLWLQPQCGGRQTR